MKKNCFQYKQECQFLLKSISVQTKTVNENSKNLKYIIKNIYLINMFVWIYIDCI